MVRTLFIVLLLAPSAFAQTKGVILFGFQNTTCNEGEDENSPRLRRRIVDLNQENGILTIQIAATARCCQTFIPNIRYEPGVLDLGFEEEGEVCECFCCYEFTYQVKGIEVDKIKVLFRGEEIEQSDEKYVTYPVEWKIVHGDTVNYVDKYGLKQGVWFSGDTLARLRYTVYADNHPIRIVYLFPNGKLKRELIKGKTKVVSDGKTYIDYFDYNRSVDYYENGQKKRECHNVDLVFGNSYEKGLCKEWNERGELIYEGIYVEKDRKP